MKYILIYCLTNNKTRCCNNMFAHVGLQTKWSDKPSPSRRHLVQGVERFVQFAMCVNIELFSIKHSHLSYQTTAPPSYGKSNDQSQFLILPIKYPSIKRWEILIIYKSTSFIFKYVNLIVNLCEKCIDKSNLDLKIISSNWERYNMLIKV